MSVTLCAKGAVDFETFCLKMCKNGHFFPKSKALISPPYVKTMPSGERFAPHSADALGKGVARS